MIIMILENKKACISYYAMMALINISGKEIKIWYKQSKVSFTSAPFCIPPSRKVEINSNYRRAGSVWLENRTVPLSGSHGQIIMTTGPRHKLTADPYLHTQIVAYTHIACALSKHTEFGGTIAQGNPHPNSMYYYSMCGCGSGGRVGHPLIGRSAVWSLAPPPASSAVCASCGLSHIFWQLRIMF